jgi:hypothetical protein
MELFLPGNVPENKWHHILTESYAFEAVRSTDRCNNSRIELAATPAARKRRFANTGVAEKNNFVRVVAGETEAAIGEASSIG